MNTQEANFQEEKRDEIVEDLLLNCENEQRKPAHPYTEKSSRDFDEKPIQNLHFDSHSLIHKEINIKVDQVQTESTFEGVEYTYGFDTGEHSVKPEFVLPEEIGIKVEDQEEDRANTDKYNTKTVKEEHLIESKIIVPEELDIKDENEGENQFIAKSAAGQVTKRHHPSNRTALLNQISPNNPRLGIPEPPIFKCVNCTYQTLRKENITSHALNHIEKTLKCPQCPYEARNKGLLRQHELVHVPKEKAKLHQCPECSYTSLWKGNLTQHMIRHKNPDNFCYKCTLCCYQSSWKSHLRRHIQHIHKSKDIQPIRCREDGCSYKTPHESYLARHMRLMHECKTMLKCSKCSFQTNYPKTLEAHELEHEDQSKWFSCTLCPHKTTSAALLKQHMLVHKSGSEINWFHCSECPFKTKRKYSLNQHKLIHNLNSEKIFKCSDCSYKTVRIGNFRDHQLVHKKPKEINEWFYCYLCTSRTSRKNYLAKHIRKKHRDSNGRINDRANTN